MKTSLAHTSLEQKFLRLGLLVYSLICAFVLFYFDGTGDSGDSVLHYLFARYAPDHPELFFDHWAKPLYVLLASPFAQFGFVGIKVFNVLISIATVYFTWKIAALAGLKHKSLIIAFFLCAPTSFALTFSGLTEPLFALLLILSVYFCLRKWFWQAALLISFLPFVRSEGLIICGVFGFFFLLSKRFKILPVLITGHLVYSLAGTFVHKDFFWVFTKIPYAHLDSVYGSGGLFHFVNELAYLIGIPIYTLLILGVIVLAWKSVKRQVSMEFQVLVLLGFLGFFVAHSLFWYLGIFNSMGLKRVFIGVLPLMVLCALFGYNFLVEISGKWKKIVALILACLILIFPFTANHAALHIEQDFALNRDQKAARQIAVMIERELGKSGCFLYSHPYLSLALDIDHFDKNVHLDLSKEAIRWSKPGDIIVWENWFGAAESGLDRTYLENEPLLRRCFEITVQDGDRQIEYLVFQRIQP